MDPRCSPNADKNVKEVFDMNGMKISYGKAT